MIRRHPKICIYFGVVLLLGLINLIAWNSTAFCDAYITYVFPIWLNTYGRLMGLFPFSVGEILIGVAMVLVAAAVIFGVAAVVIHVRFLKKRSASCASSAADRNNALASRESVSADQTNILAFFTFLKQYYLALAWIFLCVCTLMTLNCSILYHASTFSETYFADADKTYTPDELFALYNFVAEQCNILSEQIERDEKGEAIYSEDVSLTAIAAMENLGARYANLGGFYPTPKALLCSDFMCQQSMEGWYFPFTLEANYNDVMYVTNKPATLCHELAHLKGYIFEDEANFIAYLACVESDDIFFQYSGYLSVLNYIAKDVNKAKKQVEVTCEFVALNDLVKADNIFVTDAEWERINGNSVIDTQTATQATQNFLNTSLQANGVSAGTVSYSYVVKLLLQYYDF